MKTTVELADPVYRQVKARAALAGVSMRTFFTEAVREKLERDASRDEPTGWRAVFGTMPADEVREIQERLDLEFSQIRDEDWR